METVTAPRGVLLATAAVLVDQLGLGLVITDEMQEQGDSERPAGFVFRARSLKRADERVYAMTWRRIAKQHRVVILSLVEASRYSRPHWLASGRAAFGSRTVAHFGNDYHYGLLLSKDIIDSELGRSSSDAVNGSDFSHYPEVPALWFGHMQVALPRLALANKVRTALLGSEVFLTDEERKLLPRHIMSRLALTLVPALDREPQLGRYQLVRSRVPLPLGELQNVA